ncbi:MAG: putative LPS assembly protein LptD [Gemmatimonadota bacterium]
MIRELLTVSSLIALCAAAVTAQTPPQTPPAQQQPPKPKSPRELVLEKLSTMGKEPARDTGAVADSARARAVRDSLNRVRPQRPPPDMGGDSAMRALARLEGFTVTQYKGTAARFNADTGMLRLQATAEQKAAVLQAGQSMTADSLLTYDRNTFWACGYGKPILSGGSEAPIESKNVCYNTRQKIGAAHDANTQLTEGSTYNVYGDLYTKANHVYVVNGRFSDCSLDEPHYHWGSNIIKVSNKDVLVARNVTLNIGDVPVLWLPYLMQSLKKGRRSGILTPEFSINDIVRRNSRYNRKITNIGLYWAASEHIGAKAAFGWYNNNWTEVNGSLDYSFTNKFLNGGVTWREFWQSEGSKVRTISASNSWAPDERTSMQGNLGYSSSSSFIKESTFSPNELNRSIDSNGSLSRRFDWGSVAMGASRQQYLSDNKINLVLPSLSVNLSTITLFPATGDAAFFNNTTFGANGNVRRANVSVDESLTPTQFDRDDTDASGTVTMTVGRFSLGQNFTMKRGLRHAREGGTAENGDTIAAASEVLEQRMSWNSGLSFQQRLIGTSTFTPGVSLRGEMARDSVTGRLISAPTRIDANASVKIDLFGFWPGVGSFQQFRHRLSPTFSYSYSPAGQAPDSVQKRVFLATQIAEQNRLTIGLNQTIEGKRRASTESTRDTSAMAQDSMPSDTVPSDPDQPRRLPQSNVLTLLSLNTDAVVYDFVQADSGFGIQTTQISNSINSDLLRGLQLSVTHDLFRNFPIDSGAPAGTRAEREFAPHLNRLSASFSLSGSSWLFRALGLTGGPEAPAAAGSTPTPVPEAPQAGAGITPGGPELGLLGSQNRLSATETPRGPVGSWNASFSYTMIRPRKEAINEIENQMVTANVSFQPTEMWNLHWNTGYSFTTKTFTDHVLTLTRAMHDWDANFDFVKAQNGNFSFQFRVALRANPDVKFDYRQRDNTRRVQ